MQTKFFGSFWEDDIAFVSSGVSGSSTANFTSFPGSYLNGWTISMYVTFSIGVACKSNATKSRIYDIALSSPTSITGYDATQYFASNGTPYVFNRVLTMANGTVYGSITATTSQPGPRYTSGGQSYDYWRFQGNIYARKYASSNQITIGTYDTGLLQLRLTTE